MTSVAGVPFQDLWAWKCPACKLRLVRADEGMLQREASVHYLEQHGPSEDQMSLDFPPEGPATLRAV